MKLRLCHDLRSPRPCGVLRVLTASGVCVAATRQRLHKSSLPGTARVAVGVGVPVLTHASAREGIRSLYFLLPMHFAELLYIKTGVKVSVVSTATTLLFHIYISF